MTYLARVHAQRPPKVHQSSNGHPLCGGGRGGRAVHWQLDIGPANCRACIKIVLSKIVLSKIALGKNTALVPPPRFRIFKSEIALAV